MYIIVMYMIQDELVLIFFIHYTDTLVAVNLDLLYSKVFIFSFMA